MLQVIRFSPYPVPAVCRQGEHRDWFRAVRLLPSHAFPSSVAAVWVGARAGILAPPFQVAALLQKCGGAVRCCSHRRTMPTAAKRCGLTALWARTAGGLARGPVQECFLEPLFPWLPLSWHRFCILDRARQVTNGLHWNLRAEQKKPETVAAASIPSAAGTSSSSPPSLPQQQQQQQQHGSSASEWLPPKLASPPGSPMGLPQRLPATATVPGKPQL